MSTYSLQLYLYHPHTRQGITTCGTPTHTLSFYRTQINEINKKTDIVFPNEDPVEKPENHGINIKMLIIIIVVCVVFV